MLKTSLFHRLDFFTPFFNFNGCCVINFVDLGFVCWGFFLGGFFFEVKAVELLLMKFKK